jgi:hypothetical protein
MIQKQRIHRTLQAKKKKKKKKRTFFKQISQQSPHIFSSLNLGPEVDSKGQTKPNVRILLQETSRKENSLDVMFFRVQKSNLRQIIGDHEQQGSGKKKKKNESDSSSFPVLLFA